MLLNQTAQYALRAMAVLKGGAESAPVESDAGFHVVLRDP